MNILYITNKPVYPLIDGGCVAMNHFLELLIKCGYSVKNLSISTSKHPFLEEKYPEKLKNIIQPETSFIDTSISVKNALKSLFKKESYNINRFYNKDFEELITRTILSQDFDLIILESIFLGPYIDKIKEQTKAKIIVRTHNVEHEIWQKLAVQEKSFFKKLYLKKLAKDLKIEEIQILKKAHGVIAISKPDKEKLKLIHPFQNYVTIPITINPSSQTCDYSKNNLFHIGTMNWKPNIESVNFLLKLIDNNKDKFFDIQTIIAGSNMPNELLKLKSETIKVIGYVENFDEFMCRTGILCTPILSGSGVRVKILEAMSFGVPIITTPQGAEGIETSFQDNPTMFVANDEKEFIEKALLLVHSRELREQIGLNAQKLIAEKYDSEKISKKLIEFIEHIQ